jgi:hypothetical protein
MLPGAESPIDVGVHNYCCTWPGRERVIDSRLSFSVSRDAGRTTSPMREEPLRGNGVPHLHGEESG